MVISTCPLVFLANAIDILSFVPSLRLWNVQRAVGNLRGKTTVTVNGYLDRGLLGKGRVWPS